MTGEAHRLPTTSLSVERHAGGGNDGGHDLHGRVSAIEAHLVHLATRSDLAVLRNDITNLEAQLGHLATKNDLTALKVWILGGVLGGMVIVAGIAVAVVRIFA